MFVSDIEFMQMRVLMSVENRNFEDGWLSHKVPSAVLAFKWDRRKQNHPRTEGHLKKHPYILTDLGLHCILSILPWKGTNTSFASTVPSFTLLVTE